MLPAFDESVDVVVVGYGCAGAVAAITAADAGARVLLAEKDTLPGGVTILSYGSIRCAHDADDAYAYLTATNAGRIPEPLLRLLADAMVSVETEVRRLAATSRAEVLTRETGGNYPFPGCDTFFDTNVVSVPGFESPRTLYPHLLGSDSSNGWRIFKVLQDNIAQRAVDVRLGLRAHRLIVDENRAVRGAWFQDRHGRSVSVEATRGVVLACGGFESDDEMKLQYWEKTPVFSAVTAANTGDGIRMAADLGAQLWHMWHFHGSYGFRHPDPAYPVAIRAKRFSYWQPGKSTDFLDPMAWIVLDRDGERYMNECPPYSQDMGHREMTFFDPARQLFPRVPSYLVYDENARRLAPIGAPISNRPGVTFIWSDDNRREIELGIIKRADSVSELANAIGCEASALEATFGNWNALCRQGRDDDFGRPPRTMVPVDTPPYYVGEVWPLVTNTQGGLVRNVRQEVLDVFDEPIPRLYVAGELSSAFGHVYLSAANLTECFVGGRIAGSNAAAFTP